MVYILDTNFLIYYLQGAKKAEDVFNKIEVEKIRGEISIISKIELLGFANLDRNEEIKANNLISNLEIVGLDDFIVDEAINLRKKYRLKTPDAIIAATAICHNAFMITTDVAFEKIENLKIINPFK